MNWFNNIKLRQKFTITFGMIFILVIILGSVGIYSLNSVGNNFERKTKENQVLVSESIDIIQGVIGLRVASLSAALAFSDGVTNEEYQQAINELNNSYNLSKSSFEKYLEKIKQVSSNSPEDLETIQKVELVLSLSKQYYEGMLKYSDAMKVKDLNEAARIVDSIDGEKLFSAIYEIPVDSFDHLISDTALVGKDINSKNKLLLILFLIILIFGFVLSKILAVNIRKPVENLTNVAELVSKGDLSINVRTNNRDEIGILSNSIANMSDIFESMILDIKELSKNLEKGNLSYEINKDRYSGVFKEAIIEVNKTIKTLVNDTNIIVNTVSEIGEGNFDVQLPNLPGDKALAIKSIQEVLNSIKLVSAEINNLIEAAINGNLEYKIDTSKYTGEWNNTTEGLNRFVENVVIPIKETQNALNQFAKGNFSHRITNEYKGEFNEIKKTVNYTAETIDSYIAEISHILKEMANKNFDVSIDRHYLGDFEQIQKSVNLIVQNLNILTRDIISSAEQVSAGAKQISESSISLAEGATEQASSVEQLNNTVNIISKQSRDNVKSSEKANELASQARNSANNGSKQMDSMLIAMEEINAASSSISNIIKVIDDIAFQTNILALNAAVEAARAGEHGKGFAVVAEEVRSLAARSQQAAKETTDLIKSSVEKVSEGSKIANNTAEALISIVNQIEEISNLTASCAKSSKEQEHSIEEITDGISQISTVTQNNTATSEESAAASEELASQAEVFYASVSDFKLKSDLDEL